MSEEEPIVLKKKSHGLRWSLGIFLSLCLFCLIPNVVFGGIFIIGQVLFGWISFLVRVGPRVELNYLGIAIGITALVLLTMGVHRLLMRYRPSGDWTIARTVRGVLGALGVCLGGIFLVGLGHELSWFGRSPTPWFRLRNSWDVTLRPRTISKRHLVTIGLAIQNYQEGSGSLPLGGSFREDGIAGHGWMTAILPQMNQAELYQRIRFDVPWHDERNRGLFETRIPEFDDPRIETVRILPNDRAPTYYAANDRIVNANFALNLADISDGASVTIFAGEVNQKIRPWGDVTNWRSLGLGLNKSPDGFGGLSGNEGTVILLVDGSVRFISNDIDPKTLNALATPNAGDEMGNF